jgi:hypothetical protein
MNKAGLKRLGRPAIDLLEESVRLLRRAPATAIIAYYIGAVPCVLGLLYFIADMSRSAYAEDRIFESAAAMAGLYVWMKCWQTVFTSRLSAELLLEKPPQWTPGRIARMTLAQMAVQPTGLLLRLAAMFLLIPTIFAEIFYLNITVLGDGRQRGLGELLAQAYAQCRFWPKQSHVASLLLWVFRFFVWVNVCVAIAMAPMALKMFFGIETMFSQDPWAMLNTTFFATSFAAVYLCTDPIRKAFTVLRCFHGSSLRTGGDIEAQLKRVRLSRPAAAAVGALILLLSVGWLPMPASAAMKVEPKVNAEDLNRSLNDVLERREYAWRAPRERTAQAREEEGWLSKIGKGMSDWAQRMIWKVRRWAGPLWEKFWRWLLGDKASTSSSSYDWLSMLSSVRFLFIVLLAAAAALLLIVFLRGRRRRTPTSVARAEPLASQPDLNQENVTADQLPEDGWLNLASELIQRGELRLALRASYLASLAHLGQREFIRLARHKSNHDYDRELQRRARSQPELLAAFGGNLDAFERAWYGEHPVTPETLTEFSEKLQTIRAC